jgi:citronellyl-CoA dehydrogenase
MSIGVQTDMATPALDKYGSDLIKKEFLAPSISGDYVAALAVSEPNSGSDVASIKTSAKKDGDDYIINGQKMWITNATQADYFCVLANTSNDSVYHNKSLIVVPSSTPGLSVGDKIDKIGMRASDTAPVYFDNVRVPQAYRIGEEGTGFTMQMKQFQEERLFLTASTLIAMENCIKDTIEYCTERKAFGKSILDNQVIHFRLAELQTELEALRALTYKACDRFVDGKDVTMLASMAKLKSGRLIREVTDSCLQYWGGMGFTTENPVSQQYRDGRLQSIGGGTDEIMLQIICKHMDTLPKK